MLLPRSSDVLIYRALLPRTQTMRLTNGSVCLRHGPVNVATE
jgi:hypothetical protein